MISDIPIPQARKKNAENNIGSHSEVVLRLLKSLRKLIGGKEILRGKIQGAFPRRGEESEPCPVEAFYEQDRDS